MGLPGKGGFKRAKRVFLAGDGFVREVGVPPKGNGDSEKKIKLDDSLQTAWFI